MNKERNSVDDFFRESLQSHKVPPSDTARSRFLDAVVPTGTAVRNNTLRWYILAGVTISITAAVLLYSIFSHNTEPVSSKTVIGTSIGKPSASVQDVKTVDSDNSVHSSSFNSKVLHPENKTSASNSDMNQSRAKFQGNTNSKTSEWKEKLPVQEQIVLKTTVVESIAAEGIPAPSYIAEAEMPGSDLILTKADIKNQITELKPDSIIEKGNQVDDTAPISNPTPQPLSPPVVSSFEFTPFLVYSLDFNPADNQNQFMHSLAFEGQIKYRKFTFRTGAGITAAKGADRYEVEYNDYLGEYNKLDSISFTWDEKHYNLVPAYHMSETKVWDSALKLDSYYVQKSYNHLRVPVMFGYEILNKSRFVIGVNSGLEMLLFLHSRNRSNQEYAIGLNKLVNIKPVSGELTRSTFWLMANLSVAYQFSRRISLVVEPQLHYLLNPAGTASGQSESKAIPVLRTSLKIKL